MNSMFVFYIDDDFFKDGLTVKTIQEFQVLLEVPLQLDILTFYNKSTFLNAMKNIAKSESVRIENPILLIVSISSQKLMD